jgi:hypothetical protein
MSHLSQENNRTHPEGEDNGEATSAIIIHEANMSQWQGEHESIMKQGEANHETR